MNVISAQAHSIEVPAKKATRDVSIDYLRAVVTVLVVGMHSSGAYTDFAHKFSPTHGWSLLEPIVDDARSTWLGYFLQFSDVFYMALLFFVSAFLTYPSLRRHGPSGFLRERFIRLGIPYVVTVLVTVPLSYFASWQNAYPGASFGSFWVFMAKAHFFSGTSWFLWVLLAFDLVFAALYVVFDKTIATLDPFLTSLKDAPFRTALAISAFSMLLYIPMVHHFGRSYDYDNWGLFFFAPLTLQPARMGIYIVWSMAGFLAGSVGLDNGLLARPGGLVRGWKLWVVLGFSISALLCFTMNSAAAHSLEKMAPLGEHVFRNVIWVLAVTATSFGTLAFFRANCTKRNRCMDSLSRCAYVIYLMHFLFVVWMQRFLLPFHFAVWVKFWLCFSAAIVLSWLTGLVLTSIPGVRRIV